MIKSYFFLPAHSKKYIENSKSLDADYFILDLEDSVPLNKKDEALDNVLSNTKKEFYVRPYLLNERKKDFELISSILQNGYNNLIIPKSNYLIEILSKFNKNKFTLLIETANTYIHLKDIIYEYQHQISAIALGSQDLCNDLGIKHDLNTLNIVRLNLISIAKAFNVTFIDTASMDISINSNTFENECVNAYNFGCYGKFIIHPNQLVSLKNANYFSEEDIKWAKKLLNKIDIESDHIGALKFSDEVFEKPHLKKLLNIKKYIDEKQL